jgi:hypothetical protein
LPFCGLTGLIAESHPREIIVTQAVGGKARFGGLSMKKILPLLAGLLMLTGCVPVDSLNPLYTDKDIVFDESLLGEWVAMDANEKGGVKFIKEGNDAYLIVSMDTDANGEQQNTFYDAHLLNIGGQKFLDVLLQERSASDTSYPLRVGGGKGEQKIEPPLLKLGESAYMEFAVEGKNPAVLAHLRKAHRFFKVKADGKRLHLDWIDDSKLKEAVLKGTVHIGSSLVDTGLNFGDPGKNIKDIVLTASTAELQKFVAEQMNNEKIFTEHSNLQRRPN